MYATARDNVNRFASVPLSLDRHARACNSCRLVKTLDQVCACMTLIILKCVRSVATQFVETGCDNCQHLQLQNDRERAIKFTTVAYSG